MSGTKTRNQHKAETEEKMYGPHRYGRDGMGDCSCGAHMGRFDSSAPPGVDPFGECPMNPLTDKASRIWGPQPTSQIGFLLHRITSLEKRTEHAEAAYKQVAPGTKKLARELAVERRKRHNIQTKIFDIRKVLNPRLGLTSGKRKGKRSKSSKRQKR